jgi:hypothetical protein
MKLIAKHVLLTACLLALPLAISAQVDPFGAPDTIFAEVAKLDNMNWTVTVSCFNDEPVVGIAVPLKMSAGTNKIVADSAVYTEGRVAKAEWTVARFRPDTAVQCVTLGMLANIGPTEHVLAPGRGRLVTVFISSLEGKPIESLTIDTTTTEPTNTLMLIGHESLVATMTAEDMAGNQAKFNRRLITPVWVVRRVQ